MNTIIIGRTKNMKQAMGLGKRINQQFYNIPFGMFYEMLMYKAVEQNVNVVFVEESYTSKTSFCDKEFLHSFNSFKAVKQNQKIDDNGFTFVGKRLCRGLFQPSSHFPNKVMNADINGAYNIIRKVISEDVYRLVNIDRILGSHPISVFK